jgi:hypothetical protein
LGLATSETAFINDSFGLAELGSNIARNVALHLTTPVRSINLLLINVLERVHSALGLNVSDPATSMMDFDLSSVINGENFAPATFVVVGFPIAVILLLRDGRFPHRGILTIATLALIMFVLYCAVFRWQLFGARLHLPAIVLAALTVGVALDRLPHEWVRVTSIAAVIGTGLLFALFNETRPLVANSQVLRSGAVESVLALDSDEIRYLTRREAMEPFAKIEELMEGCDRVATKLESADLAAPWEYPLWLAVDADTEMWAFDVDNPSGQFERPPEPACLLVVTSSPGPTMRYAGLTYTRAAYSPIVSAYIP